LFSGEYLITGFFIGIVDEMAYEDYNNIEKEIVWE